jgi:hypothetical protein
MTVRPLPEFPIFRNRQKFKAKGERKIQSVSPKAQAIIKAAQPYEGHGTGYTGEALWNVHNLDITDKHRLLNAVIGFVNVKYRYQGLVHMVTCRIQGRTVFFSGPKGSEVEMEGEHAFYIALPDAGIMQTEPIIHTLQFFTDVVWELICKFEGEFK